MEWGLVIGAAVPVSGGIFVLAKLGIAEWQQAPYVEASATRARDQPGAVDIAIRISNRSAAPLYVETYRVVVPEYGPPSLRKPRSWREPFDPFGARRVAQRIEPLLPAATDWPFVECADRLDVGFGIFGDLEIDIRMAWRRFGRDHDGVRFKLPIKPQAIVTRAF